MLLTWAPTIHRSSQCASLLAALHVLHAEGQALVIVALLQDLLADACR